MRGGLVALVWAAVLVLPSVASAWTNDLGEVTVSESGGLSPRTRGAVETVAGVLGVTPTELQSGTMRMLRVERGDEVVQAFAPGFAVPMSFVAADPTTAAPLLGDDLVTAMAAGVVMSEATAALRDARVGDVITVEGWDGSVHALPLSAIVPDHDLGWTELLVPASIATDLGVDRPSRAVMWGVNTTVVDLLLRSILVDAPVRVSGPGSEGRVFVDGVLPMVRVKELFGEFSFRETGTDRIVTDDAWYEANIVTVTLPGLGQFRCHRAVLPSIRGALAELEALGLADEIDGADFQLAGGCYNPRLARGGDLDRGFAISRHSWGIAINFNPSTKRFGDQPTLSPAFGDVLRSWGFAWGAGWPAPDPMHFEWRSEPVDHSRTVCRDSIAPFVTEAPVLLPGPSCVP